MIRRLDVDGFRSLQKFTLLLEGGLNVLVGPNGVGKSNILACLDFAGEVVGRRLPRAVGKLGGPGRVFTRKGDGQLASSLDFKVTGITAATEQDDTVYLYYSYRCEIVRKGEEGSLEFGEQTLALHVLDVEGNAWRRVLGVKGRGDEGFVVTNLVVSRLGPRSLPSKHRTRKEVKEAIETAANASGWQSECLLGRLDGLLYRVYAVKEDLTEGLRLNISPDVARRAGAWGDEPGLTIEGEGLPETLWAIKENDAGRYKRIETLVKCANPEVVGIRVEQSMRDASQTVVFQIQGEDGETVELPITAMSDGTVKWLALLTAITSHKKWLAGMTLEEPENYLHPWMQQQLIDMLREACEDHSLMTVLVSTHSETILNRVRPQEVCLCGMERGKTWVRRPKNQNELDAAIKEEGFGLGYFYLAGAIEDE